LSGSTRQTTSINHPSSTSSTSPTIEPSNAIFVWREFSAIYGNAWLNEFGERPNHVWIEELAKLSPRDIETGLNQCKRSGSNFAPRLPQFLAYCVPQIVEDVYRHERETYQRLNLPKPESNPEIRRIEMAKIRTELKILVIPTASKEALEQRQAAMIQAAEILVKQHEATA
jgi:hypothetical protein